MLIDIISKVNIQNNEKYFNILMYYKLNKKYYDVE